MSLKALMVHIGVFFAVLIALLVTSETVKAQSQPFADKPADEVILEDAGLQIVNLTGITDNDGATQTITITAVSSNQVVIPNDSINVVYTNFDATGTLEYTSSPDANGLVSITITVMDDGGGLDTFVTNFTVTVNTVNDLPTFTKGPDQPEASNTLFEDDGSIVRSNWATDINAGGTIGNENFQNLTFILTPIDTIGNLTFDDISINSTGTLIFTPSANTNGTTEIKIELQDDGLDALPDVNISEPDTIVITVTSVNDPPVYTPGSDITIDEGSGPQSFSAWATGIGTGGGSDEVSQNLTFVLTETSISSFLVFTTPPTLDPATGDLTFEADLQANGSASYDVTLVDDGDAVSPSNNTSTPRTLTITVTGINDPPNATIPVTYDSFEDAGEVSVPGFATDISAGGSDEETSQVVRFELEVLSTTGTLVFDQLPSINNIGTLFFQTSEHTNGTAEVQISVFDDGATDSPNTNIGPVSNLTITVDAVNDPPTFTKGSDPILLEDNGPITFTAWATNISSGPSDESGQSVSFQIIQQWTEGTIAFASGPDISPSGDLSFETSLHTNGRAAYEIVLVDDGASDGLNLNTSIIQPLVFVIAAVNDPPVYVIGPDQVADENSGLITIENWATGMSSGGGTDEVDQTYSFTVEIVEVIGNVVFSIGPLISPEGALSFQTAPNTFGSGRFLLNLVDDGFSDPPDNNTSDNQNFTITINEINDPPTEIVLSNNSIQEKLPEQSIVGTFTALDPDDVTHTFALVGGNGSDDNGSFTIGGDQLITNTTFDFEVKRLFTIRVSAFDGENTIERIFLIDIIRQPVTAVTYPSAFTPNGDGENDIWEIESIEYFPGAIITIYNRNGQKVFDSIGYQEPWDGTYSGNDLPIDTYYVVIKLNDEIDTVNATVTILR